MLRTNLSAKAFKLGDRTGSRSGSTPALLRTSRNCSVKSVDRSWIKKRVSRKKPLQASVRFHAVCNIHVSQGSGTIPAMWISRVIKRITKST